MIPPWIFFIKLIKPTKIQPLLSHLQNPPEYCVSEGGTDPILIIEMCFRVLPETEPSRRSLPVATRAAALPPSQEHR
jgi:hypothetical protein